MLLHLPDARSISLDRPRIMGILNVTPDSFSDGGRHSEVDAAVAHGLQMARDGAAFIDVGGESTRPGAQRVDAAEQIRRTEPVIRGLRAALDDMGEPGRGVVISIDTTQALVAATALDAGAGVINDISAGREDAAMFALAAKRGAPIVLMHMLGAPATMQNNPTYGDVVVELLQHLADRAAAAIAAGVPQSQIVIDPGIGFGKTREHNLKLLAALDRFVATGYPVLLGASRKRFMGSICTNADGTVPAPTDLLGATCATTSLGVAKGVRIFRVHDVRINRQAMDVAWAIANA